MRLRDRLERLEEASKEVFNGMDKQREYYRSWKDNDPGATYLLKEFKDYCTEKGCVDDIKARIELTRTDDVAADLARKYLESYRNYVKTNFGVTTDAVRNTLGKVGISL